MTTATAKALGVRGFRHEALFYKGRDDFVSHALAFIGDGLDQGEPVLVIVRAEKIAWLRDALGSDAGRVCFTDMAEVGRNPARIIPVWTDFFSKPIAEGAHVRGIGEPIWAERSSNELTECQHHESLINLAFPPDAPGWVLCPYDVETLDELVIDGALRSHPIVSWNGSSEESAVYPGVTGSEHFDAPLPEPSAEVFEVPFTLRSLGRLRSSVSAFAWSHGIGDARAADLIFAVNEVATNALHHGHGYVSFRMWREADTLVCEVRDGGRLREPLAGRIRPPTMQGGGRGLWAVNQICDLVQIRSTPAGTIVRLHVSLH